MNEAIRTLGPEILGFLHATARDEGTANEAFSRFSEAVWRGLSGFQNRSSLRAWCYTVARRSLYRTQRRANRHVRMPTSQLAQVVDRVRTETLPFLRTEAKAGLLALRDEMSADDRILLTLRIDRRMAWRDLAIVMLAGDEDDAPEPDDATITRTAATLRKRFERVKERLKRLAAERGVIPPE